jgi:hypothetical protein
MATKGLIRKNRESNYRVIEDRKCDRGPITGSPDYPIFSSDSAFRRRDRAIQIRSQNWNAEEYY